MSIFSGALTDKFDKKKTMFVRDFLAAVCTIIELQGRVYACRNTMQFFTIPIGLFLGGFMVDNICEPYMQLHSKNGVLSLLFGQGKGSGAAMTLFILGILGIAHCLLMGIKLNKYQYKD